MIYEDHASSGIYLWSKVVCFVLLWGDLPSQVVSCCAPGIFRKLSMGLFGAIVWKLLIIEPFFQWKLNKIETEKCIGVWHCCCLLILETAQPVRFNRVYFIIFRAKMWKILIFERILLLKIQTNCKNEVWKEKSVEPSMCSHLGQQHRLH
jgi:hypothetical protein